METAKSLVSESDIEAILRKQVDKAKAGDDRAARFVLDFVGKAHAAPQPVNATQNIIHVHVPAGVSADGEDGLRIKTLALIEASGPLTPGQVAAQLGADPAAVERAVDHPWFKAAGGGRLRLAAQR